ncbi:hypothetical protein [Exiguobacterium sp.]|uniref:hypothetical protein n=1 Tax=Exiguobacterium sp. TaxID=44751 RepID=UPI00263B4AA9|nr:hypothetical protein [Exiguobacterium sp.]MCC5891272.1 hypothetical protein [Exiguobacterium sp.]
MKKMKVGELRNELKQFDQKELIELIVGLYKQHADVKTTLNRYFMEGFEAEEAMRLIKKIVQLGENQTSYFVNFNILRQGAAIVKEAERFTDPVLTERVRIYYLTYFGGYVTEVGELLELQEPRELEVFFKQFEKVMRLVQQDPGLLLPIEDEVDAMIEEFPIEQKKETIAFWERQKDWAKQQLRT